MNALFTVITIDFYNHPNITFLDNQPHLVAVLFSDSRCLLHFLLLNQPQSVENKSNVLPSFC